MCNFGLIIVPEEATIEPGVPYFYLNGDKSMKVVGEEISKDQQEIMYKIITDLRKERDRKLCQN